MYSELKNKLVRQVRLISELEYYEKAMQHEYLINKVDGHNFELIETQTNKLIKLDTLERIDSYLRLRNKTNIFRNY